MRPDQIEERLRILAGGLAAIRASTDEQRVIKSFVLGSIYSLTHAARLEFIDGTGQRLDANYDRRMSECANQIARGEFPESGQWLAGASFNSALLRLAAAYHRVLQEILIQRRLLKKSDRRVLPCVEDLVFTHDLVKKSEVENLKVVHGDVNHLKHAAAGLLVKGRQTSFAIEIAAVREAIGLLGILTAD